MPRIKRQRSVGGGGPVGKRSKGSGMARKRFAARMSMTSIQRQVHRIVQGTEFSLGLSNSTGWSSAGSNSVQFAFTQNGIYYSIGGGALALFGLGYSNSVSLATVYDQYKLKHVEVELMYSCNNSSENTPTIALPIIYGVVDYDDTSPLANSAIALGYSTCKTMQMGNSSGTSGGKQYMKCKAPAVPTTVQLATGGTANAALLHSPWLNSDVNTTEHTGLKFLYVPVSSNATLVGYVSFCFRAFFEYKNVK